MQKSLKIYDLILFYDVSLLIEDNWLSENIKGELNPLAPISTTNFLLAWTDLVLLRIVQNEQLFIYQQNKGIYVQLTADSLKSIITTFLALCNYEYLTIITFKKFIKIL